MRIEAMDLVVRYPGGRRPALDGVSIEADAGELHAVLGPNGSGKSTLLKALLGIVPVDAGLTSIDGRPLHEWSRRELARSVGVVSQSETVHFALTVRELVAMGRYPHLGPLEGERDEDREAIRTALERCDVADIAGRDVSTLSGGELQRARIARALAQQPKALVLDEPTNSLDIRHEMAILELLRAAADDGMTVVMVTHDLDLAARYADRMLLLHEGRIAAMGGPAEVLTEAALEEVYGWPVRVDRDPETGAPRVTPLRPPPPPGP